MNTRVIALAVAVTLAAGLPTVAQAYVGPGAGLSLAAAFWAILVAVGTIIAFTVTWPIRRMLRRRSAGGPRKDAGREHERASEEPGMAQERGGHGG